MGAPVAHFEIVSKDPARLITFYGELFGWSIGDSPTPGYSMVDTEAEPTAVSGGIGATQGPDGPTGVTVYLRVDDVQGYVDKAVELGGSLIAEAMDLPDDFGRIAVVADPDGNPVGLWA
ncbi:MAG TPA: VOC family protein [Acidimicrobiales bacterium]|jgi:predicted enzyme related to lactoylglutathione lyase|nr:VOC family protein [Acidimicrobiales bacterium]